MSPGDYGVRLTRAAARVTPELQASVAVVMERAREIAQAKFGEYQRNWAPLAPSTLEDHGGADTPLLVTGEMRDSIRSEVTGAKRVNGLLYSTDPKIFYSEYGTTTEPPRPVLKESVRQALREEGIGRFRFILTRVIA